ncbi:MAG: archease [Promethearchaeota archaeon]
MEFEYSDEITSDQLFRAYGSTLPEVFRAAARAMFGVMYDLEEITLETEINVCAQGRDEEHLLYDWLSNLLIEFEVEGVFFADFAITSINETSKGELQLVGIAKGSQKMPEFRTHVKGVTLHRFSLQRVNNRYMATIVVDI